ncbi:MAG TPA: hypothetical protein VE078_07980 [Thermoanaerobaculia bacterium]|nr:hypothetical protein [Thermoanaerobaculia bacterium]
MRFEAKMIEASFVWRSLRFQGKGQVHLQDVAMVLEGDFPKFLIPLLLRFYHRILSERTYRTIPYSKIVAYKPPGKLFGRYHKVVFEDPERRRITAAFKLRRPRENALFTARLEEYRVAAKALLAS